jgi:hypothetical protein
MHTLVGQQLCFCQTDATQLFNDESVVFDLAHNLAMRAFSSPVAFFLVMLINVHMVDGCDLTCNNRTVTGQFVKCPMCVCRRVCGIHENDAIYNCFFQVSEYLNPLVVICQ